MGIPVIGDVIDAVKDIVSEVVVDKDKKIEANIKLKELEDRYAQRVHDEVIAIQEVNKTEAEHSSVFVAGWRPFAGWVGGVGLAWATIGQPLGEFVGRLLGYRGEFPVVNTELLILILGGMLGLGGYRTFEKVKGVARETVSGTATTSVPTNVEVGEDGSVSVTTSSKMEEVPPKKKRKKVFGIF